MPVVEGIPSSMTGDGLIVLGINFHTLAALPDFPSVFQALRLGSKLQFSLLARDALMRDGDVQEHDTCKLLHILSKIMKATNYLVV